MNEVGRVLFQCCDLLLQLLVPPHKVPRLQSYLPQSTLFQSISSPFEALGTIGPALIGYVSADLREAGATGLILAAEGPLQGVAHRLLWLRRTGAALGNDALKTHGVQRDAGALLLKQQALLLRVQVKVVQQIGDDAPLPPWAGGG